VEKNKARGEWLMIRKAIFLQMLISLAVVMTACGAKTSTSTATPSPAATTTPASTNNATSSADASGPVTVSGKWELVGKEGDWKGTVDMVGMDGYLWSVEPDGSLYKTDPSSGNFTEVGEKGSFQHLKHLEGMDHMLWTVEGDTLYKTDPKTGKWEKSGEGGGWARTVAMAGLNGILYSIEPDGSLWKTDASGNDTLIDKGGFKGCTDLAAMDGKLWTIENGSLYRTDPSSLKWEQVGKEGEFTNVTAMISGAANLFMIDNAGTLYKVDPNGTSTVLGERGSYGHTTVLTTLNGKLWTVEDGNLYKTN
jgi:hypothetical protein